MKLLYKPFGIVLGILAGLVSKKLFDVVWGLFDEEEPPKPTTQEADWSKVLAAAAVQGVTFKVTRAAVDRAGAKSFHHITGVWPGDKYPDESQAAEAVR
jgi:pectin methylesterase-like acyl-CoA thioesterase